jgi:hypothetical protein
MSRNLFESMTIGMLQRAADQKISSFALDGFLALVREASQERIKLLSSISAGQSGGSSLDLSSLLCFDVVALAAARAFKGDPSAAGHGDAASVLTGLWGTAQAGRALWGDHFLFETAHYVEGRGQALKETARALGAEALAFSLTQGVLAPQFAEFVAKDLAQG